MISTLQLHTAKAFPIVHFLASRGFYPVSGAGAEWFYLSPLREEKTPSFSVSTTKNVFYDFGGPEAYNGDIIRLIQLLDGCTFQQAVLSIEGLDQPRAAFSFSGRPTATGSTSGGLSILAVKPLQHPALIQYIQRRKIPFALAAQYLTEVHYQHHGKAFFSIGFLNDQGGFELRSQQFKGCLPPKAVSRFVVDQSPKVCVFEGFFDFLSALVFFGRSTPKYTTIVLNSTANLKQALPMLQGFKWVNTFLDNDRAGQSTNDALCKAGLWVNDCRLLYDGFKDFNDCLIRRP